MISGKASPVVRDLIKEAAISVDRAASCLREARSGCGWAGTTRDDVVVDLLAAGDCLIRAHQGISVAHRVLTGKLTAPTDEKVKA